MLKVTKIGYTLKNGTTRNANVLSTSDEDAIRFLRKVTKNNITTVNDVGMDSEVHAYTDEALEYIRKKTNVAKTNVDVPEQNEMQEKASKVYTCPWCDRDFEKSTGLKIHIQRTHKKEE